MSVGPHLEPLAEKILADIREGLAAGVVDGHPPDTQVHILSAAVSLKRIADALESVVHSGREGGYVLVDMIKAA